MNYIMNFIGESTNSIPFEPEQSLWFRRANSLRKTANLIVFRTIYSIKASPSAICCVQYIMKRFCYWAYQIYTDTSISWKNRISGIITRKSRSRSTFKAKNNANKPWIICSFLNFLMKILWICVKIHKIKSQIIKKINKISNPSNQWFQNQRKFFFMIN